MGQMGGPDGDGGAHPHHPYHYQALLAAVQNPNQGLHAFPLPFHVPLHHAPQGGQGAGAPAAGPGPGPAADTAASTHNAAPHSQHSRGFADWSASSSAFASVSAQPAPATTNAPPFPYNLSQSYTLWSHYMLNKNAMPYSSYPAPHEENLHPLRHTHIPPDKDSGSTYSMETAGSASSLGFDSFTTMSLGPNICAHMSPMEGSLPAKEAENSEDLPTVVRNSDEMDTMNSDEVHRDTAATLPESKPSHESCTTKFNSGEYQVVLRKELTKSDVANVGRIVLPKKDAEASLPPLVQGDPLILQMDDMVLPVTWKFKYRFWPNNKSRMYILEAAGEFVKTHGLQAGDALIIYKNSVPGKFIIRAEKAIQQTNP
ncbi:B3 domain-containing protein IDEF1-like isoform X1 [Panicum hallii]|uniref:B3 domain-containing protein IDEF1-like isoform X1 n=1 Tax=Panicum hallii TaxID=206008 RepID=UPI000DF4DC70|nr:B3 domain-containing protein IDEF1-like isoform X1 [Panicum hallii]